MGRRKRDGNHLPQKNSSIRIQWEMRKRDTDVNKTMINITKEPNDAHKNTLKEEILEDITKKFIEKILDMVNLNVQDVLKKFEGTKKTQKQIKKLREDFNKHQSETKDPIKREIDELKLTTQNIKEELDKDMENLRKKNQIEILEIKSPCSQKTQ
jgi:hypothetical protein